MAFLTKLKSTNNTLYEKIRAFPLKTVLRSENKTTEDDFERLLKFRPKHTDIMKAPDSFDGREIWEGLITPVLDQGSCGSCFAFATTSVLADRFNIQSQGRMIVKLSPTKMILCDQQGEETKIEHPDQQITEIDAITAQGDLVGACGGESLYNAWRYLYLYGTVENSCLPYDLKDNPLDFSSLGKNTTNDTIPLCSSVTGSLQDMCFNQHLNLFTGEEYGEAGRNYRCKHFYGIAGVAEDGGSEYNIRYDIFRWGTVSTGMRVYTDFYNFDSKNDIYSWNGEGDQVGGHAIAIVGYGTENNVPYWIVRNSWGTSWGRNGYFYMKRGNDECGIESNCIACVPDFFYSASQDVAQNVWAENEELKLLRKRIDTDLSFKGGGIDPSIGYSRRVISTKPWIDFSRPVALQDLYDRTKFIAGIHSKKENRPKKCEDYYYELFIIILLLIVGALLYKLYLYKKNN